MKELYIKILSNFSDEELEVTYHLIQIGKETNKEVLAEFYYKTEYLINYNKIKASKILSDIKNDIEVYLKKPRIEEMSLETIDIYDEYLSSSEAVVYVEFEDIKERDKVLKKLKKDIPKEYHNTFEKYDETINAEILLYSDFIMIFNIINRDKEIEKPVEKNMDQNKDENVEEKENMKNKENMKDKENMEEKGEMEL